RVVRGVANQDVAELEGCGVGRALAITPEQLPADERPQTGVKPTPSILAQERIDSCPFEYPPDDRPALCNRSFGSREAVDAGCHERLDRRRDRQRRVTRLNDEPDHFLDEQGIALRCIENPPSECLGNER